MADFSKVNSVIFTKVILEKAFNFLRTAGADGYESVVLFAGIQEQDSFKIRKLYIPRQKSYKGPDGLMYYVEFEELLKLDDWLYEENLSLFCQMHTHPGRAYHSTTDDSNSIVTSIGGLSIVIPDFAIAPINPKNWAIYKLVKGNGWKDVRENFDNYKINII